MYRYWATLESNGATDPIGVCFFITAVHVLTATHCLTDWGLKEGSEVWLGLGAAVRLQGKVTELDPSTDLAIIEAKLPVNDVASRAAHPIVPRIGIPWKAPCPVEQVTLHGEITETEAQLQTLKPPRRGLQLSVLENLGDYGGFSGSPVEIRQMDVNPHHRPDENNAGEWFHPVVGPAGVILRQQFESTPDVVRAAPVLHALHILEILTILKQLSLWPSQPDLEATLRVSSVRTLNERYLEELRWQSDQGLASIGVVREVKEVLKRHGLLNGNSDEPDEPQGPLN